MAVIANRYTTERTLIAYAGGGSAEVGVGRYGMDGEAG